VWHREAGIALSSASRARILTAPRVPLLQIDLDAPRIRPVARMRAARVRRHLEAELGNGVGDGLPSGFGTASLLLTRRPSWRDREASK
jgi:hypothetical protein